MGCPSATELEGFFDSGAPGDVARASALLAHVRECSLCHEALREDLSSRLPPPGAAPPGAAPPGPRRRPRATVVLLAGVGVALVAFSRRPGGNRRDVAPVTSSAPVSSSRGSRR